LPKIDILKNVEAEAGAVIDLQDKSRLADINALDQIGTDISSLYQSITHLCTENNSLKKELSEITSKLLQIMLSDIAMH